jgi:hypothetical protein
VILLLPVSRFSVSYELAAGRPYSRLERRVLDAVAAGGASLDELAHLFRVHERLLVECVVTLVGAGWVALTGGGSPRFVLTREGRAAHESGTEPLSIRTRTAKPQVVFLERVAGQVARGSEVRAYRMEDLQALLDEPVKVRERVHRNSLDEAEVQQLLSRQQGEWPRWIGPITLTSKGSLYVPIDVDIEAGTAKGLPSAWARALLPLLKVVARDHVPTGVRTRPTKVPQRSRFRAVVDPPAPRPPASSPIQVSASDLLTTSADHGTLFRTALAAPGGALFVSSPLLHAQHFDEIAANVATAIATGKRVDLTFGGDSDVSGDVLKEFVAKLRQSAYEADRARASELLRLGTEPAGSRVPLLVHNAENETVCVIGNHPWFLDRSASQLSLRVTAPGLVSQIVRVASTMCRLGGVETASSVGRWRQLAVRAADESAKDLARRRYSESDPSSSAVLAVEEGAHRPEVAGAVVGTRAETPGGGVTGLFLYLSGPAAIPVATASSTTPPEQF